ncbi:MAG: hypothetical protein KDE19_24400 [Caldilineaceae bacterium]|nr:hypothetical protein [Caldilineaceae bacterium]
MRRLLFIVLIALIPLTVACRPIVNLGGGTAVVEPLAGGEFNKFFPKDDGDYNVLFTQEKEGFAQAQLNFQGSEVATLSVSDTANNPDALEKFQDTDSEVAGYPAAGVGSLGTAILVAERFQVQVRSKDDSFTEEQRTDWIEQFDLAGLAALNE